MFLRTTIAFTLVIGVVSAATYYVPDDYPTIQGAINACVDGDVVIVRPGTYYENINFKGKKIVVKSEYGPDITVIDGNRAGITVRFTNGETKVSVLEGFTVRNASDFSYYGGGISIGSSSPTIRGNIIEDNHCRMGGVVCYSRAYPIIENNIIRENKAQTWGGALLGDANACPIVRNNLIYSNSADSHGQGLRFWDCGNVNFCPAIVNNTIVFHTAPGGPWNGGAIESDGQSHLYLRNNIIAFNAVGIQCTEGGTVDNDYNDVFGNGSNYSNCSPGPDDISSNPAFADITEHDFHLLYNSPCINAGDESAAVVSFLDLEGDPRVTLNSIDIGADEFYFHLYHTGDIIKGLPATVKIVGGPGMPVLLALGSGILNQCKMTQYGELWLSMPLVKSWSFGAIPNSGVLTLPTTIPFNCQSGSQHPFQALVGPLGNPNSVLTNLLTLTVE